MWRVVHTAREIDAGVAENEVRLASLRCNEARVMVSYVVLAMTTLVSVPSAFCLAAVLRRCHKLRDTSQRLPRVARESA